MCGTSPYTEYRLRKKKAMRWQWIRTIYCHRSLMGASTALCSYFYFQQAPVQAEAYPPNYLGASPHATLHEIDTVEWRIDKWSAFHPRPVCTAAIRGTVQVKGDGPVFGNGILITSQGHVLTCAHLVHSNKNVCVEFSDNQTYRTRLVGIDWDADLAILQVVGQPIGRYYEWFNDLAGVDYRRARQEQKSSSEQGDLRNKIKELGGGKSQDTGDPQLQTEITLLDHNVTKAALEATQRAESRQYRSVEEVSSYVYDTSYSSVSMPRNMDLDQWQVWWRSLRVGDWIYRLYHRILERNWRLNDEDIIGGERLRVAKYREKHQRGAGTGEQQQAKEMEASDQSTTSKIRRLVGKLRRSHSFVHPLELSTHESKLTTREKQDPLLVLKNYYQESRGSVDEFRITTSRIPLASHRSLPNSLFCSGINPPSIEPSTLNIVRVLPDVTTAVPRCRQAISELDGWRGNATPGYFFGRRLDESPLWADDSHDPSLPVIRLAPSTFMSRPGSPILDSGGNLVGIVLRGDTKIHDAIDLTDPESVKRLNVMLQTNNSARCLEKPISPSNFGCSYHFRPHEQTAVVDVVMPDSFAERKGIQAGDKITHVNGDCIQSSYDLSKCIKRYLETGTKCSLHLKRLKDHIKSPLCSVDLYAISQARHSVDTVLHRGKEKSSIEGYEQKLESLYGTRETYTVHVVLD